MPAIINRCHELKYCSISLGDAKYFYAANYSFGNDRQDGCNPWQNAWPGDAPRAYSARKPGGPPIQPLAIRKQSQASLGPLVPARIAGVPASWRLSWRNLTHDRARFIVTLVGISFSVVLMAVQVGLLLGAIATASGLVRQAGVDFWITARRTINVDQSVEIPRRLRLRARAVPGTASADNYIVRFAVWRRPDGGSEGVTIVGFDLATGVGRPWKLLAGSVAALDAPDTVIIDRFYAAKLDVTALGDTVEINGHRARIVGFTEGIRAFTQSPYIFTSLPTARRMTDVADDATNYVLVRMAAGADAARTRAALAKALPDVDVLTTGGFARASAAYWLISTGAGAGLIVGTLLGLIVGVVITAQTLYAATAERIAEYATLRAIGASTGRTAWIVLRQGLISGAIGYALGMLGTIVALHIVRDTSVVMVLPWPFAAGLGLVTLLMCAGASVVAIRKVISTPPTLAFQ